MRHRYHISATAPSLAEAVVHRSRQCDDLAPPMQPLSTSTVESAELEMCPTCCDVDDFTEQAASVAELLNRDECPWCDDYDGEHVGRHASRAHPEAWADHQEADA